MAISFKNDFAVIKVVALRESKHRALRLLRNTVCAKVHGLNRLGPVLGEVGLRKPIYQ